MEGWRGLYLLLLICFGQNFRVQVRAELVQIFDVLEGVPVGTVIGVIGKEGGADIPQPPYLIVPLAGSSDPDVDLIINQKTGEIRTKSELDRERTRSYSVSAIPLNGESISVTVRVQDINDNSPEFVPNNLQLDIPENIPSGTKRKLAPAVDQDLGEFGTHDYAIASGNVGNVFEVSYDISNPRLDLVVKGELDRERVEAYTLVIVARDGGSPSRTGSLTLKVNVQDLNDSPPLFSRQRYFTSISADLEVGSSILKVEATDADKGDNSRVTYSINRRQSDRDRHFDIDSQTGLLTLAKKLDFERQNVHEIVIVARDGGEVPQETSAFITVRVSGLGENPRLSSGGESGESSIEYTESPISTVVALPAEGSNEFAPEFESRSYSVEVVESAEPGSSVLKVKAEDKEDGENGHVVYSLRYDENGSKTYSDWFQIDRESGLVTTQSYLDCELEGSPKVIIVATDKGNPPKSSSSVLQVSISDVNDNKPLFESSFYDVQLAEDVNPGQCFLTLKAKDMDCGSNAIVSYTFQDESSSDTFNIGNKDGKMCLAQELDHEAKDVHNVIVLATDKGGLSTSTLVRVSVNDVNDNFPEFAPTSYDATINAAHPLNLPVLSLKASDGDSGSNAEISYTITSGNEDGAFSLDARSGNLYLTRQLKSGQRSQLSIEATDGQGKKSASQASVEVTVVEKLSVKNIYKFEAREDVSPYSEIGKMDLQITDYEVTILESSYPGYFSVHSTTGTLRSEARLDHEANPRVVLNVKITTAQNEEFFSQIIVDITDVNDNAPEFAVPLVVLSVPEDFPSGENARVLYVCTATDADSDLNGKLTYKLRNEDLRFNIDPVTAEIRLMSSLDYELETQHEIVIEAEDSGQPRLKSSMKLTLLVHDVNDNEPVFDNATYTGRIVQSSSANGAEIVTVRATDKDQGRNGRITYQVSRNPYFKMLPTKGSLVLKRPLDKEARDIIEVTVTAVDHGSPSLQATARVQIFVADRNDHSPTFDEKTYTFSTPENSRLGVVIGSVQARDEDKGRNGEIEYRLRTTIKKFSIEAKSGQISTSELLDREEKSEYELLVEAVDRGQPPKSSQTVVKVLIEDVNDQTPGLEHPASRTFFTRELSIAGTTIGKLTVHDTDKDDRVTYDIIDGSSLVSIDRLSGEVQLKRSLGFDNSNFTFSVKISDSASPPHQITETINVQVVNDDLNQLSLDALPREISVDETSVSIGSFLGSLATASSGTNGSSKLQYFVNNNVNTFPFYINAGTGDVFLIRPLNSTLKSSYELEVGVGSENLPPQITRLTIKVTGHNGGSKPSFPTDPIVVRVPESSKIGSRILTVSPQDKSVWPLKYQIIEQSPSDSPSFDINEKTGELKIVKSLDYENMQNHLLTVRVSSIDDSTEFQYSTLLTVAVVVEDVNDLVPTFLSTDNIEITSETVLNRPIFTILAADDDSGEWGIVKYVVRDGNLDAIFSVDEKSGELSLQKSPLVGKSSYQLTVRAEDGGQLFSEQVLKIRIRQDSSIAPKFVDKMMKLNVAENLPPNSRIALLQVSNPLGEELEYSILATDETDENEQKRFQVDPSSGELRTGSTLDREERSEYMLVVGVTSKRSPSWRDAAQLQIAVVDVNDNDPTFGQTCRPVEIPENAAENSFVHAVVAYDSDFGDNGRISYTLSGGEGSFTLEPETGKLFAGTLDREKKSKYDLLITATDNGESPRSTTCSIEVKVIDKNDNDPSFAQSIYSASVREDVAKGTEVVRVIATDADENSNAEIRYAIRNATDLAFAIGEATGTIITTGLLDRETVSEYTFFVVATDGGQDVVRSSSAKVTILVTDANDHTPEFDQFPFRINSSATPSVGVPLLRLTAHDPDLGPNGQLTFNLVRPEHRAIFDLTPDEGVLTVSSASDLTWDPATLTVLEVSVSDAGRPPKSSTGLVEIKIEGGPATKLDFQREVYYAEIEENPQSGADLIQLQAVRSDGRRQRITYTFLRGNDLGAFEINSNNGLIRVRDPEMIDFEKNREFVLTVAGQGLGEENLNAYAKCVIKVKNVNDNTPRFSQAIYEAGILEGLPKNSIVTQVEAFDLDDQFEIGSRLIFEIIDGNVDGAFTMRSSSPGLVLTNTVLDREIRDRYELTIAAKDMGSPTLTGTTKVVVVVLDVNDSPLQFPAVAPIKISKGLRPGSLIGTVRANDIDTFPPISYKISNSDDVTEVAVDTFTGQIYLLQKPSNWRTNPFMVTISASDQVYTAERQISVFYEEASKDCRPKFESPLYQMELDANLTLSSSPKIVGQVAAAFCGSEVDIQYFVEDDNDGVFSIASNGTLIVTSGGLKNVNVSVVSIGAKDRKSKKIGRAVVSVKIRTQPLNKIEFADFPEYDVKVDAQQREVYKVKIANSNNEKFIYSMTQNERFKIDSFTGVIYNVGRTDSTSNDVTLDITVRRIDESLSEGITRKLKFVVPPLSNKNEPKFSSINVTISATASLSETIQLCPEHGSSNDPSIQIVSGNEDHLFSLDNLNRRLLLSRRPSSSMSSSHYVVVKMGSKNRLSLCRINIFIVKNSTSTAKTSTFYFPITDAVTSVKENVPIGTFVFRPPIVVEGNEIVSFWTESDLFTVDPKSGDISTRIGMDYESARIHDLQIFGKTKAGQSACNVQVLIESVDEYPPVFGKTQYLFNLPRDAMPGDVLGQVQASDRDKGPDGHIVYSLATPNLYFTVNPAKGTILVSRPPDTGLLSPARRARRSVQEVRLVIQANSRRLGSLSSTVQAFVSVDEMALPSRAEDGGSGSVAPWVTGVIVGIVLIIVALAVAALFYCRIKRAKDDKERKLRLTGSNTSGLADQSLEMSVAPSSGTSHGGVAISRFPPQYSEIVSDFDRNISTTTSILKGHGSTSGGCLTRSEFSEKSSGRGSVEDEEDADVEIRMINEGGYLSPVSGPTGLNGPDSSNACSFLNEEDKLSDQGSVQNTEEYLARLGIDIRKPPNIKGLDGAMANALSDHYSAGSIYNRILDETMSEHSVSKHGGGASSTGGSMYGGATQRRNNLPSLTGSLSSVVHSEDELAGSYNWDYLLDWGPQYRPLAHVFKEISQLRDDPQSGGGQLSPAAASTVVPPFTGNKILPFMTTLKNPTASRLMARPTARSPISHDVLTQSALSPNFHPALSPLATKSPSVSPMSSVAHKRDMNNKVSHI